jgi:hypothetical protein
VSVEAFVTAFAQRTRRYIGFTDDGICPFCTHPVTTKVNVTSTTDSDTVVVECDCSQCPAGIRAPLGLILLNRPRIAAKFYDAGIDFSETPFWEQEWCTFSAPTVHQHNPLRVRLESAVGDERLRVIVDEDVEIQDITT